MIELYLVRHGQTATKHANSVIGFTDVGLSALGKSNVKALVADTDKCKFDLYYSSNLIRAVDTANILGAITPIQDARLRELNFGDWEGLSWDQAYKADPEFFDRWSLDWVNTCTPGGESFQDLAARAKRWLDEIISLPENQILLVAAHAGSIRALICQALQLPLSSAMKFSVDHAHVSKLVLTNQGNRCVFLNSNKFQQI